MEEEEERIGKRKARGRSRRKRKRKRKEKGEEEDGNEEPRRKGSNVEDKDEARRGEASEWREIRFSFFLMPRHTHQFGAQRLLQLLQFAVRLEQHALAFCPAACRLAHLFVARPFSASDSATSRIPPRLP